MSPTASTLAAWMRGAAALPNPPRVEHAPSGPAVHFTHAGLPCEARVLGRVREEGEEFFFVSVRVGGYLAPVAGLWKSTGLFDGLGRRAAAPGGLDERALHQAVGSALRRSRREWEPSALAVRRTEAWPDRYGDFARALLAPAPPPEGGAARYVRDAGTRRIVAADA